MHRQLMGSCRVSIYCEYTTYIFTTVRAPQNACGSRALRVCRSQSSLSPLLKLLVCVVVCVFNSHLNMSRVRSPVGLRNIKNVYILSIN